MYNVWYSWLAWPPYLICRQPVLCNFSAFLGKIRNRKWIWMRTHCFRFTSGFGVYPIDAHVQVCQEITLHQIWRYNVNTIDRDCIVLDCAFHKTDKLSPSLGKPSQSHFFRCQCLCVSLIYITCRIFCANILRVITFWNVGLGQTLEKSEF
jgi:hypothetical protein